MKWQEWVIIQKNRFFELWNQLNNLKYIALGLPVLDVWLQSRGLDVPITVLILLALGGISGVWGISVLWDRAHMFHYERDWQNKRNKIVLRQYEEIKKIREILEKLK